MRNIAKTMKDAFLYFADRPRFMEYMKEKLRKAGIDVSNLRDLRYTSPYEDYDLEYIPAEGVFEKARPLATQFYLEHLAGRTWKHRKTGEPTKIVLGRYEEMVKNPEAYKNEIDFYNRLVKNLANEYIYQVAYNDKPEDEAWKSALGELDRYFNAPPKTKYKYWEPREGYGKNIPEFFRNFTAGRDFTKGISRLWPDKK